MACLHADIESRPRLNVLTGNVAHVRNVLRRTIYISINQGNAITIGTPTRSCPVLTDSLDEIGFRSRAVASSAAAATFSVPSLAR
jgi:hypothetical protein